MLCFLCGRSQLFPFCFREQNYLYPLSTALFIFSPYSSRPLFSLTHSALQSYQALFRVKFASTINPTAVYDGVEDPQTNRAMRICHVAFDAFFDDTKKLVSEGVKKDVKLRNAAASSSDLRNAAIIRGKEREIALKAWLKSDFPLAYGEDAGHQTYNLLVKAVAEDDVVASHGLRGWDKNALAPSEFVNNLIEMSRPDHPKSPFAPVLKDGSFLPVLKVAHSAILDIARIDGVATQQAFLKKVLRLALITFHVQYFPSHVQHTGTRGAPHKIPVFHSWGHLGRRDPASTSLLLPDPDPSLSFSIEPETVAYNNAILNDCNAPWKACHLDLTSIKLHLRRTTLPGDYGVLSESDGGYVNDTYDWVKKHYDGTKRIHHLALLVAVVVSSSLLPNLFVAKNSRRLFMSFHTQEDIRRIYNAMDWQQRNKKGMKDKSIFIAMITTFIIAIYEEKSPLRKHIAKPGNNLGLGKHWTNKYCTSFYFIISFPF